VRNSPQLRLFKPAAAGPAPRQGGIRPALFYSTFALLSLTNVLTAVAFVMAPDIARLTGGQNELVLAAYEDRIAELRIEVDRLHSRQYAQAGDINLQMQELSQQQELLSEQHLYVRRLAEKAAELGLRTADSAPAGTTRAPVAAVGAVTLTGDSRKDLAATQQAVDAMMADSRMALAAITETARNSTDAILTELGAVGIRPSLPGTAVGGPLLPAIEASDAANLVDDANAVSEALMRFKAARSAIDAAPVHRPLSGMTRTSSGFGNRTDPFTRGRAFHSGLDFPAPTGTKVLSAGDGKVTFVGVRSGYGNVVEIAHAGGLVTRYAHLSSFIAKVGQSVKTGTPIARVGSTGRSTGPHLHFEVRRDDTAFDPSRFLTVGKRLQKFISQA